jgi:hypothetical protein
MLDATQNFETELSDERLFNWHAALFPKGRSGMYKITTGDWRKGNRSPMQVISGAMGQERVHFEAPDSSVLEKEMILILQNGLTGSLLVLIVHWMLHRKFWQRFFQKPISGINISTNQSMKDSA